MGDINNVINFLFFVILLYFAKGSQFQDKPHIVVIIGDDIGWNDFGFHGSNQIPTPNIDALGYNGVFLNKFYTQAICTPSRAAFLTGKYPMRYGYQGIPLSCGEDRSIPADVELLPEKLKKLGYKTHLVGKWHLGAAQKNDTPTARGFDTHFGYWNGFIGYYDHFGYQNMFKDWNMSVTWSGLDLHDFFKPQWGYQGRYATELFTEKSLEVIDNHNASEPLFLQLGHLAAHTGANGTELGVPNITETDQKYSYIDEPMRRRYADVVNQLDKSVGQVVKKLKDRGMLENSIVLFFSDNGAQTSGVYENFGSNYPLKGACSDSFKASETIRQGLLQEQSLSSDRQIITLHTITTKADIVGLAIKSLDLTTMLLGGVRGSAVLFSPLLSKKGYINDHLMHITDLFSTFLHVAGAETRDFIGLDGINQWESISENKPSLREEILLNVDEKNGFSGLIGNSGQYKFLNGSYQNGSYDGAQGNTGRSLKTPGYDIIAVLSSDVNQAIRDLQECSSLTPESITNLRKQLDISSCNGKIRTTDPPCLGECLFDLWKDPCEIENIVNTKPIIAETLKARLEKFVQQMEPQRNKKVDLNSNPKYCNNTWFPWLDEDGCYSASGTSFNAALIDL